MKNLIKFVISASFVLYLFGLLVLLFLGTRGYIWADLSLIEYIKSSSNFVPFRTIGTYVKAIFDGSMNIDIPIKNLFGNFIMFLPMGIFFPYFIRRNQKVSTLFISMIILLSAIEVTQLVTRRGSFDIDDLILNIFGALIGFGFWKTLFVQKLMNHYLPTKGLKTESSF
jgi:glycopeptide antibiotics resistance protein